jgi:hypothetical protein
MARLAAAYTIVLSIAAAIGFIQRTGIADPAPAVLLRFNRT